MGDNVQVSRFKIPTIAMTTALREISNEWEENEKNPAKDRRWRLLIENVVREKWRKKRRRKKTIVIMANFTPDDRDTKRRTTWLCGKPKRVD